MPPGHALARRKRLALADTLLAGDPQNLGTLPVLQAYVQAQRLDQDMTVGSMICDLDRRRLYACAGPPCENEYVVFEMED